MRPLLPLLLLACLGSRAFAIDVIEDIHRGDFSKTNATPPSDYGAYRNGDHYEWTTYQRDYARESYGHKFEWSDPGLGKVSVCIEVDGETGGGRYRNLVDEQHCVKPATAYRWYVPYVGENSRCVEEDVATKGEKFARIVEAEHCPKPATEYLWKKKIASSKPVCAEVDAETQGELFRADAKPYLCGHSLDVELAYGRKLASPPSRAPASVARPAPVPLEVDKTYWEDPEDLVDHVHRSADKIHRR